MLRAGAGKPADASSAVQPRAEVDGGAVVEYDAAPHAGPTVPLMLRQRPYIRQFCDWHHGLPGLLSAAPASLWRE
ncbi:hypothetical protein GCM10020367_08590 [Streptomyces sannanensis]|uniref:Uncharacterized protein n=1 Tax=Streptomyces sannanensis TaxID=285536 RepID=A0ABP6S6A3_9ACTN